MNNVSLLKSDKRYTYKQSSVSNQIYFGLHPADKSSVDSSCVLTPTLWLFIWIQHGPLEGSNSPLKVSNMHQEKTAIKRVPWLLFPPTKAVLATSCFGFSWLWLSRPSILVCLPNNWPVITPTDLPPPTAMEPWYHRVPNAHWLGTNAKGGFFFHSVEGDSFWRHSFLMFGAVQLWSACFWWMKTKHSLKNSSR